MKKLFVAVAAVMVVSATAFSSNNKMTNRVDDVQDTVTTDTVVATEAFALVLADDTVTSDTVVSTEAFMLALADDTVTSDTILTKDEAVPFLVMADDTIQSDTVVVDQNQVFLAFADEEEKSDTTTTEKEKVEEVVEKAENKFGFIA